MKKLLQLLILFFCALQSFESNAQKNASGQLNDVITDGTYSFIMRNGKDDEIRKSGDSLIHEKNIMKIIQVKNSGSTIVLGLEKIKTGQYIPEDFKESFANNRFWVMVVQYIDENSFGLSWREGLLTKDEISNAVQQSYEGKNFFFRTYYNEKYMKTLSALKTIETIADTELISNFYKSEEFESWHLQYIEDAQNGGSFGGDDFRSEVLNRICIKYGYNPIGANDSLRKFED